MCPEKNQEMFIDARKKLVLPQLNKLLTKVNIELKRIEEVILCVIIIMMGVILIINVIARQLGVSMFFNDEIIGFLMVWVTFVGVSNTTRAGRNIRMSAITDLFPTRVQKIIMLIISTASAILMFYLVYISVNYVYGIYYWQRVTQALGIPYWIVIVIVPVGLSMTGIQYVLTINKNIQEKEDVWVSIERKNKSDEL